MRRKLMVVVLSRKLNPDRDIDEERFVKD